VWRASSQRGDCDNSKVGLKSVSGLVRGGRAGTAFKLHVDARRNRGLANLESFPAVRSDDRESTNFWCFFRMRLQSGTIAGATFCFCRDSRAWRERLAANDGSCHASVCEARPAARNIVTKLVSLLEVGDFRDTVECTMQAVTAMNAVVARGQTARVPRRAPRLSSRTSVRAFRASRCATSRLPPPRFHPPRFSALDALRDRD
jgi:hypothetical protein